jgi:hypothetical protein
MSPGFKDLMTICSFIQQVKRVSLMKGILWLVKPDVSKLNKIYNSGIF